MISLFAAEIRLGTLAVPMKISINTVLMRGCIDAALERCTSLRMETNTFYVSWDAIAKPLSEAELFMPIDQFI